LIDIPIYPEIVFLTLTRTSAFAAIMRILVM